MLCWISILHLALIHVFPEDSGGNTKWLKTSAVLAQWLSGRVLDLRRRGHRFETKGLQVRAPPTSLCCGPWGRHIYPSLVLVQPRKTHPCLTERLLMGRKESNQTKTSAAIVHWCTENDVMEINTCNSLLDEKQLFSHSTRKCTCVS